MDKPLFLLAGAGRPSWPSGAIGSRWVVLGRRAGATPSPGELVPIETLAALLAEEPDVLFVLEPGQAIGCTDLVTSISDSTAASGAALILLVPRAEPPTLRARNDGPVRSFAVTTGVLRASREILAATRIEDLGFVLAQAVGSGALRVETLLVRQFPPSLPGRVAVAPAMPIAAIIPHRGRKEDLAATLDLLSRADAAGLVIRVGLDEDDPSEYVDLVTAFPHVEFFVVAPVPAGPDAIRQVLIERTGEGLIVFQDSDDVSCSDRVETLRAAVDRNGCEFIGSHELRVDELRGEILAIRYPLDASAAMAVGPGNPLLFPASIITAGAFHRTGGLSSDWPYANDTQFILRSYFFTRVANVDEFLYVRRRHAGSVTTSPETGMGTPSRSAQGLMWEASFRDVRDGRLSLTESSLSAKRDISRIRIRRLEPARSCLYPN
jgi:hypothetical protein